MCVCFTGKKSLDITEGAFYSFLLSPSDPDSHWGGKLYLKLTCFFPVLFLIHFKNRYLFRNKKYYGFVYLKKYIDFYCNWPFFSVDINLGFIHIVIDTVHFNKVLLKGNLYI